MAVQFGPIGRSLGRYAVLFQIPDHHLPQRGIVINDNDTTYIRQHN
jgi:hypothetical protein